MSNTIIISHSDNEISKKIATDIAAISEKFAVITAPSADDITHLCSAHGCSLLIIDGIQCQQHRELHKQLPDDTAVLIIGESNLLEALLSKITCLTRSCYILNAKTPSSLLQHTVQLLLKQRQAALELIRARDMIYQLTRSLQSNKESLHAQQHYLDILSERDGLTGLYNRKQLTTILQEKFRNAKEYGTDLSLLILDIDNFKIINRSFGHNFGDFILNEIAARLTSNTRDSDLCFRFGGGEFIILLPQSHVVHGRQAAEKLVTCCSSKQFDNGKTSCMVTVSIGVASFRDSMPQTPEHLINMADTALIQAKQEGRNRCFVYQHISSSEPEETLHHHN